MSTTQQSSSKRHIKVIIIIGLCMTVAGAIYTIINFFGIYGAISGVSLEPGSVEVKAVEERLSVLAHNRAIGGIMFVMGVAISGGGTLLLARANKRSQARG